MSARFPGILPSQLARLIYGYLNEEVENVALTYLRESRYLAESRELYEQGYAFDTEYKGFSLKEIIKDYCSISHYVDQQLKSSMLIVHGNLLEKLTALITGVVPEIARSESSITSSMSTRLGEVPFSVRYDTSRQPEKRLPPPPPKDDATQEASSLTGENFCPTCNSSPIVETLTTGVKRKKSMPLHQNKRKRASEVFRLDEVTRNRPTTPAGASPAQRFGVDKETFLSHVELGREVSKGPKEGRLTRSRSLSDLRLQNERRKKRPKFFTPSKRKVEPTEEVIKATLKELYDNHELHEQMARSINLAREEVSEENAIDEAIESIIEKTTSDPVFSDIMEQTLGNFDLLTYLKPSTKPASIKDRLRNAGREKECKTRSSKCSNSSKTVDEISDMLVMEAAKDTAELRPYPEIHYSPADCNIVTGTLDADGNCVFYSNPRAPNTSLSLPPAPTASQVYGKGRYRNILPKFGQITLSDLHPVVVCTPVMAPPPPPPPQMVVPAIVEPPVKQTKARKVGRKSTRLSSAANKSKVDETIVVAPSATPVRDYSDMPAINFFATPQPPPLPERPTTPESEPPPPAENPTPAFPPPPPPPTVEEKSKPAPTPALPPPPPPEVTPDAPLPIRRRQSLSTPRRKSYVRTLEFETPGKKCATSPKGRPPSVGRTPKTLEDSVQQIKERLALATPVETSPDKDRPRIATRMPVRKKLSEAWDALSGVGCVLGNSTLADTTDTDISKCELTVIDKSKAWDSGLRLHVIEGDLSLPRKDCPTTRPPKRVRKAQKKPKPRPKKSPKPKRKPSSPKATRRITRSKTIISPSKINATSKRSTYSISNGSSSAFETSSSADEASTMIEVVDNKNKDLVEMTPAKIDDLPTVEDTPFTKLLKENVVSVDIDLSMIQTPFFPVTPCLLEGQITPMHATRGTDYSSSSSYYKPELTSPAGLKEMGVTNETVEALQQSEEHLEDVLTVSGRNLVVSPEKPVVKKNKITDYYASRTEIVATETHNNKKKTVVSNSNIEKSTEDLSTKNNKRKTVVSNSNNIEKSTEDLSTKNNKRKTVVSNSNNIQKSTEDLSTKNNKKKTVVCNSYNTEKSTEDLSTKNITEEALAVSKPSNEEKINDIINEGKKMIEKRCVVGKNLSFLKMQMIAQCNIKLSENIPIIEKKSDIRQELEKKKQDTLKRIKESNEKRPPSRNRKKPLERPLKIRISPKKPDVVISVPLTCSTPNNKEKAVENDVAENSPAKRSRMSGDELVDVKKDIPPFVDNGEYPELCLKTKKKLHVVKHILLLKDVVDYLETFSDTQHPKITLKPSIKKLFDIMFKWLKHPHKHELEASSAIKEVMIVSLDSFKKIHHGMCSKTPVKNLDKSQVDYRKLMLKDIDVDSFLSKLHGRETNT